MKISIHQPAYIPWLGYFDKISKVDQFVFLDSVQFGKNSYINRNQIKTSSGPLWLSIPVKLKGHINQEIKDVLIDGAKWKSKHLKSIFYNYQKAPYFENLFPKIENLYSIETVNLSELLMDQLLFWNSELGIRTPIVKSSDLSLTGKKSDLILDICMKLGATEYYSGVNGKDYLDISKFNDCGINVVFQDYQYPRYKQSFKGFLPNLSIVDFWMNSHNIECM